MAGEDYSRAIVSKLVLIIAILREPLQVEIISEQLLIVYWGLLIYVRMLRDPAEENVGFRLWN